MRVFNEKQGQAIGHIVGAGITFLDRKIAAHISRIIRFIQIVGDCQPGGTAALWELVGTQVFRYKRVHQRVTLTVQSGSILDLEYVFRSVVARIQETVGKEFKRSKPLISEGLFK